MKESIGSTQLFVIVVIMVLIFAAIISFTTNKSNAYAVKDAIISVIEDHGGITTSNKSDILNEIVTKIEDYGYGVTGNALPGYDCYQGYNHTAISSTSDGKALFCIKKIDGQQADGTLKNKNTYKVVVFYGMKFPFFGDSFIFNMVGETKGVA